PSPRPAWWRSPATARSATSSAPARWGSTATSPSRSTWRRSRRSSPSRPAERTRRPRGSGLLRQLERREVGEDALGEGERRLAVLRRQRRGEPPRQVQAAAELLEGRAVGAGAPAVLTVRLLARPIAERADRVD